MILNRIASNLAKNIDLYLIRLFHKLQDMKKIFNIGTSP